MYTIIAFVGKAGSGKDTLLRAVCDKFGDRVHEIVSCTTRPPREGEIDGVNYHFLTGEAFGEKVIQGEMLEATCFNDWFYGTSFDSLNPDKVNIGVFNPAGIDSLKQHSSHIRLIVFFVNTKDKERLIRQLNRENNPDIDEIMRRYKTDMIDFEDFINEGEYLELLNNNKNDFKFNIEYLTQYIDNLAEVL